MILVRVKRNKWRKYGRLEDNEDKENGGEDWSRN